MNSNIVVYNKKTHCIKNNIEEKFFSISLSTLEMQFSIKEKKLIGVFGYLPLISVYKTEIFMPIINTDLPFCLNSLEPVEPYATYFYDDFFVESKRYFDDDNIQYDVNQGIILVGTPVNIEDIVHRVNDCVCLVCDGSNNIKSIYIKPAIFLDS